MDTANTNEKFTIAVIGGGAASVAFLHHFTRLVAPSVAARIRIELFEPRPSVGPGLAIRLTGIGKGSSDAYDYVVNATGSAKDIDSPAISPLGWQMLRDGLAAPDWRGGIQVDFDTGAILERSGEPDWQLRALGHITCGAYFYVSSLEMVAKRARKIAGDIVSALSENVTLRPLGKVAA
ncbi:hypothetical protein WS71_09130 [Burkholderia mayonis]|uniref:Uncharacterized protein n=1 Tax=Burkholderia mayonis TaxID=1385591 RepID=A0A1B4FUZ1_9BURK|nr:hypothetical protein WS71_09130 [Burkholderia mayonis]KVE54453.1 hypothetical protein WS71_05285 [Burkholderia mayonis]